MSDNDNIMDNFKDMFDYEDDYDEQVNKYLMFKIEERIYGINITYVDGIIELQEITEIPDMPHFIRGVINLREKVVPVMDMRLRLKCQEKKYDERTCIIIVMINNISVGILVDTVTEVVNIQKENINPVPRFNNTDNKFIEGIGKVNDEIKILLDIQKLLYEYKLEEIYNNSSVLTR